MQITSIYISRYLMQGASQHPHRFLRKLDGISQHSLHGKPYSKRPAAAPIGLFRLECGYSGCASLVLLMLMQYRVKSMSQKGMV